MDLIINFNNGFHEFGQLIYKFYFVSLIRRFNSMIINITSYWRINLPQISLIRAYIVMDILYVHVYYSNFSSAFEIYFFHL